MTSLPPFGKRFVISPLRREVAIETIVNSEAHKGEVGAGYRGKIPKRGFGLEKGLDGEKRRRRSAKNHGVGYVGHYLRGVMVGGQRHPRRGL
jgi:hypothetical protein